MIKSARQYSVSELLCVNEKVKFVIPKYQREYVWGKDNWENLFDDLWVNPPGYFLGSIICINQTDDTIGIQKLELVDGQQRVITLSILYAAIYSTLMKCEPQDEEAKYELTDLRYRIVFKGKNCDLRVIPSCQGKNDKDYRVVLQNAGILHDVDDSSYAGNRRLFKAYRHFIDRLDELDDKGKRIFDPKEIAKLLDLLNQASIVKIEVSSHADAFTLFESLNNRGVPLTALELIKNNLLAVLEKKTPESINENFDKWRHLLENLTEDPRAQERYLRQYYNAFKYKQEINVTGIPFATKSTIMRVYDKLIDRDAERFFSDLYSKSKLYNKLVMPMSDGVSKPLAKHLQSLDRIGGTPAFTLLLYLLSEHPDADMAGICEFLVRYFVRRSITDTPPTRDLDRTFLGLIDAIRSQPDSKVDILVRQKLLTAGSYATDDMFRMKLSGNVYDENEDATRFILCQIEQSRQTIEKFTDLWERDDKGLFIWTIEHIFPQGQKIPECWVKMIADGDESRAKDYHYEYVHKLGNLTMTGYNSKLSNKSFHEKRDRKDNEGRYVGYRNGLFLNRTLNDKTKWTIEDIKERTNQLVDLSLELFKF